MPARSSVLLLQGRCDIGAIEVYSLEQKRFTFVPCKGVSEAIAEVQTRSMFAPFSEVAIRLASNSCLSFRNRLNLNLSFSNEVVEASTCDWISGPVYHNCSFEEVSRRNTSMMCLLYCLRIGGGVGFSTKNRNEGGSIDDHFGRPSLS